MFLFMNIYILLQYTRIPQGQSFFEGYIPTINGTIEADYELCECQEDLGNDETLIHCGPVTGDACMQGTLIQWRIQDFPEEGAPTLRGFRQW